MKLYEKYIRGIAVCLLCAMVMLVTELIRVQPGVKNIHTQDEEVRDTRWDEDTIIDVITGEKSIYEIFHVENVQKEYHIAPRVLQQECLQKVRLKTNETDREVLYRIVQAEAGGEDELGKKMVADVIVNRVKNEKFPNTVRDVVFQNSGGKVQFAPTADGRYQSVSVSAETIEAVDEALTEEDYTSGALYFVATSKTSADKITWFETHLVCKGTHGGHTFYQ